MKTKRILAIVLMIILTVVPITAVSAYTGAVAELSATGYDNYKPRLTAPAKSNSYYYSNKNIFYSIGYGMPNCTAYAWGRAYELLGTRPKLSVDSAHYWYDYNKTNKYYPYGKTPKLGAIACWDNPYGGHVAVVEKITKDTVTLSHSEWGGRTFYLTEFALGDSSAGIYSSGWKFCGYIYILDGVQEPDGDIYKVTSDNGINMRKGPGTSYDVLTAVPYDTELVVTATKKADGYTWGKTTFDGCTGWCVLDFTKLIYKKPVVTAPPATEAPITTAAPVTTVPLTSTAVTDESVATTTADIAETVTQSTDALETILPSFSADANGDGITSIADATLIQKFIAGIENNMDFSAADANGDGFISIADATYIQKMLASLI